MRSSQSLPAIEMMEQQQVPFLGPTARTVGANSSSAQETSDSDVRESYIIQPPEAQVEEPEDVGEPSMGEAVDGPMPKKDKKKTRRLTKTKK